MTKKAVYAIAGCFGMLILILDTKTILCGAQDGIILCLQTIIPALFPFIMLSTIITGVVLGKNIRILWPIRKLCNIPIGAESILLLGFLGGYPIGAKIISQAYSSKSISKQTALRMLGFCSNAGPAFIFGILSAIFTNATVSWYLWIIHINSALFVGILLPRQGNFICKIPATESPALQTILKDTIKTLSQICGWVIIFRILICVFEKWFFPYLPVEFRVILSGMLELSNGCISLSMLPSDEMKFIYASGFLAFGGLCVVMQTAAVTKELGCASYFPGKILQTLFSLLLSILVSPLIYNNIELISYKTPIIILITLIFTVLYFIYKKSCGIYSKDDV